MAALEYPLLFPFAIFSEYFEFNSLNWRPAEGSEFSSDCNAQQIDKDLHILEQIENKF